MALAQSPAGPIEKIPNLKKRQTHRYWRLINGEWVQTHLLPSDPVNRDAYLARGFRINPPGEEPESKPDTEKEALYAEIAQLRKEREELKAKKEKVTA